MDQAQIFFNIQTSMTIDEIYQVIELRHKPKISANFADIPNIINPRANGLQRVADTVHDGLDETAAKSTLPSTFDQSNYEHQSEDEHLQQFLYELNKGSPNLTKITPFLAGNYEAFFRVPLYNKNNSNHDENGTRTNNHRCSIIEAILKKIGLASSKIMISLDYTFPELLCDIGYFKDLTCFFANRHCQENDAAGKLTLSSKSSSPHDIGFYSLQTPVHFVWTTPREEPFKTYLPRWVLAENPVPLDKTNTPVSENNSCSRFRTYSGWNTGYSVYNPDKHESDWYKSTTLFHDPDNNEVVVTDSSWTSKSSKSQPDYTIFANTMLGISQKNPLELLSPDLTMATINTATSFFSMVHALAKYSGDQFTAIMHPNSYTPAMLAHVIFIIYNIRSDISPINRIYQQSNSNIIMIEITSTPVQLEQYLKNNPTEAGIYATTIESILKDLAVQDVMRQEITHGRIPDLISSDNYNNIESQNPVIYADANRTRLNMRKQPRLFKQLKNKRENPLDPYNYEHVWLDDYVVIFMTHDRLAAADALERFAEGVILVSARNPEGITVFSLFIRKDQLDENAQLYKEFSSKYKLYREVYEDLQSEMSKMPQHLTKHFGIPLMDIMSFVSIAKIQEDITAINTFILSLSTDTLQQNIIKGLLTHKCMKIESSLAIFTDSLRRFEVLYELPESLEGFTVLMKYMQSICNEPDQTVITLGSELNEAYDPAWLTRNKETLMKYLPMLSTRISILKEIVQTISSLQELYNSVVLLSGITRVAPTDISILLFLSDNCGIITKSLALRISKLDINKYITTELGRVIRVPRNRDMNKVLEVAFRIVRETILPDMFGLPGPFLDLYDKVDTITREYLITYYKDRTKFLVGSITGKSVSDELRIVANCLTKLFPETIQESDYASHIEKISQDFDLVKDSEKEETFKNPTKLLSKKKLLQKSEEELAKQTRVQEIIKDFTETGEQRPVRIMSTLLNAVRSITGRRGGNLNKTKINTKSKNINKRITRKIIGGAHPIQNFIVLKNEISKLFTMFYIILSMIYYCLISVSNLYTNIDRDFSNTCIHMDNGELYPLNDNIGLLLQQLDVNIKYIHNIMIVVARDCIPEIYACFSEDVSKNIFISGLTVIIEKVLQPKQMTSMQSELIKLIFAECENYYKINHILLQGFIDRYDTDSMTKLIIESETYSIIESDKLDDIHIDFINNISSMLLDGISIELDAHTNMSNNQKKYINNILSIFFYSLIELLHLKTIDTSYSKYEYICKNLIYITSEQLKSHSSLSTLKSTLQLPPTGVNLHITEYDSTLTPDFTDELIAKDIVGDFPTINDNNVLLEFIEQKPVPETFNPTLLGLRDAIIRDITSTRGNALPAVPSYQTLDQTLDQTVVDNKSRVLEQLKELADTSTYPGNEFSATLPSPPPQQVSPSTGMDIDTSQEQIPMTVDIIPEKNIAFFEIEYLPYFDIPGGDAYKLELIQKIKRSGSVDEIQQWLNKAKMFSETIQQLNQMPFIDATKTIIMSIANENKDKNNKDNKKAFDTLVEQYRNSSLEMSKLIRARNEATRTIGSLIYLSDIERNVYSSEINIVNIHEIDIIINNANKQNAINIINNMQLLTPSDKSDYIRKINNATTIKEIEQIIIEVPTMYSIALDIINKAESSNIKSKYLLLLKGVDADEEIYEVIEKFEDELKSEIKENTGGNNMTKKNKPRRTILNHRSHVRKTRKNTKRPKYIKKNATRRRR